jgi:hypothetical protein
MIFFAILSNFTVAQDYVRRLPFLLLHQIQISDVLLLSACKLEVSLATKSAEGLCSTTF